MDGPAGYARFLKARLVERLRASGLDVAYHRGRGDVLTYRGERGEEVDVLDFAGGFGAALFGHNHPVLTARARELLDEERPMHVQASVRPFAGLLAARLSGELERISGVEYRVVLANSGAEAVEAAIKHAALERDRRLERIAASIRESADQLGQKDRRRAASRAEEVLALRERPPRFVALEGAFHGKTSGAVQLTHHAEYRDPWRSLGVRAAFVPPGDRAALERVLAGATVEYRDLEGPRSFVDVAALFAEPIQGEGGVRELSDEFLRALREAADAGGFPLVLDEIQCGMGRTGAFLASEKSGVPGDYVLLAKALGGGLAKISALLVRADRYQEDFSTRHSSTYAEDDRASAIALSALELLETDRIPARCRDAGSYLRGRLEELSARYPAQLLSVRGRGLMVGVELAAPADSSSPLLRVLGDQELLGLVVAGHMLREARIRVFPTLSARLTLRIEPSAYVERGAIDRFCAALERVCQALAAGDAYSLTRFLVGREAEPPAEAPAPVPSARQDQGPEEGDEPVAFLAHFLKPGDLRLWDRSLEALSDEDCARFFDRTRGALEPFVVGRIRVRSDRGSSVHVTVIGVAFTPEPVMEAFRQGEGEWALELVDRGVELARELGCSVLGFGGYTSIITDNCRDVDARGLAVTSGNSLTAAAAVEALFQEASRRGIAGGRLGIVGAAGNIGAVLAEVTADRVGELLLVGRPRARRRLERVASRVAGAARVEIATDLASLRGCDLVISATNASRPIVLPEHVGEGPVVLSDIAVPGDVDPSVAGARPEAVILKGGVVKTPGGQQIAIDGMDLAPGQLYGCLAEAILLGLGGVRESFSRGPLQAERVRRIRNLALEHGFDLSAD